MNRKNQLICDDDYDYDEEYWDEEYDEFNRLFGHDHYEEMTIHENDIKLFLSKYCYDTNTIYYKNFIKLTQFVLFHEKRYEGLRQYIAHKCGYQDMQTGRCEICDFHHRNKKPDANHLVFKFIYNAINKVYGDNAKTTNIIIGNSLIGKFMKQVKLEEKEYYKKQWIKDDVLMKEWLKNLDIDKMKIVY